MNREEPLYDIEHLEKRYDRTDTKVYGEKALQWSLQIDYITVGGVSHNILVKGVCVGFYSVGRNIRNGYVSTEEGSLGYTDRIYQVELMTDSEGNLIEADLEKYRCCNVNQTFVSHNEAMRYLDRVINSHHWYNEEHDANDIINQHSCTLIWESAKGIIHKHD